MADQRRVSVRQAVLAYLDKRKPAIVDRRTFLRIRRHAARATGRSKLPSPAYLLDVLLDTEVPVDAAIGGIPTDLRGRVRIGDLEEAKESLLAMTREYVAAPDPQRASDVRRAVVRTKDHLKLGIPRGMSEEKQRVKGVILEWLLVWLENPTIFEPWVEAWEVRLSEQGPASSRDRPSRARNATT